MRSIVSLVVTIVTAIVVFVLASGCSLDKRLIGERLCSQFPAVCEYVETD